MTMQTRLRIALIGLGTWAKTGHLPLYQSARFKRIVEVKAICSRSLEKAREWARLFDIPYAYDDYLQLLREQNLDVMVVCTPDHVHFEYVMQALDAGLHILVEKPLAIQPEQCLAIIVKAAEKQKKVITLYHKRADPLWAEAARRIRREEFGALRMGWACIQNPIIVPQGDYFMSDLATHSDPNWFLGTHFYDLLRYMTGQNPVDVTAHRFGRQGQSSGNRDSIKSDFVFDNGGAVSVFVSWNLSKNYPSLTQQEMRLHFDYGELNLNGTQRGFIQDAQAGYTYVNPYFMRPTNSGIVGYAADFIESSILSILDPAYPLQVILPSLEDSWWTTSMADAVRKSVQSGKRITIKPPPSMGNAFL